MKESPLHYIGRVAPNFIARLRMQEEILQDLRINGEKGYPLAKGTYHDLFLTESLNNGDNTCAPIEELAGLDITFAQMIQELLENADKRPIVALDFGGMTGLSWLRLANHFRCEVMQGDIVFVVSNVALDIDDHIPTAEKLSSTERNFITANKDLVHYIQADSATLAETILTSQAG